MPKTQNKQKWRKQTEGALLCTVDVVALYPSIPHEDGLEAIREALDRRVNLSVATDTLVELASLVLDNNYFEFDNKFYRQTLGTAIGIKFAPAFANLFMTRLEERLLKESADLNLVWMRFIDDVFFIWTHGEEKLDSFINFLNSSHDTIKFTSEHSSNSINFLDVTVSVKQGGGGSLLQTYSASPRILISICTRRLVTLGIPRRLYPIVKH